MGDIQKTVEGKEMPHGAVHLPLGTFKTAGAHAPSVRDDIDCCEIGTVAGAHGPAVLQTARLFCLTTGATARSDITRDQIDRFTALMPKIGRRFGTHRIHFSVPAEAVLLQAQAVGEQTRDPVTIKRHLSRLSLIRDDKSASIEQRIGPGFRLDPTMDEIERLEGWDQHRFLLLTEHEGTIRHGAALDRFELIAAAPNRSFEWPQEIIEHALDIAGRQKSSGRNFVVTRHLGLRLIPGFWTAARTDRPK